MMNILFTALALFSLIAVHAQDLNEAVVDTSYKDTTSIKDVDHLPTFPGGMKKMFKFIDKKFDYTDSTCINKRVYVKFIVDRQGVIREPYVPVGSDESCDAFALKIVNAMPSWNAGRKDGLRVNCWCTIPIIFPNEVKKKRHKKNR